MTEGGPAAPEVRIRRYLDSHGGSVEVRVDTLLSSWGIDGVDAADVERITDLLAGTGVEVVPALSGASAPDAVVEVRVVRTVPRPVPGPSATPEPSRPSRPPSRRPTRELPSVEMPANGAGLAAFVAGLAGALLVLGPKVLYGYSLALGVIALGFAISGRRRLEREPWIRGQRLLLGGVVLGATAIAAGVYGSTTVEEASDDEALPVAADRAEVEGAARERFCRSHAGDELSRISGSDFGEPQALKEATDAALERSGGAPPGADCAVIALDLVADSWNFRRDESGYDDAEEQIERIRDFQRENDLRRPRF